MSTTSTPTAPDAPATAPKSPAVPLDLSGLPYRRFTDCVHCGLCLAACPTYLETGNENDSPRGRIHLMRAVADGRLEPADSVVRHLDTCLDCRSCETACPSGVQYGSIIEAFRFALEPRRKRPLLDDVVRDAVFFGLFPYPDLVAPAMWGAKVFQALGLERLVRELGLDALMPHAMRKMMNLLPAPGAWQADREIPEVTPAVGTKRARVAFFTGCSASVMFPGTNWNTVQVLARNGVEVVTPRGQVCCGAVHYHAGESSAPADFAKTNVDVFNALGVDAVLTNCGGCGHMLQHAKDVLRGEPRYLEAAEKFENSVADVSEFLVKLGPVRPEKPVETVATYHDSCHLSHGMGVRGEPRQLLSLVPGLRMVPLRESDICCGAAGTYNMTEPEMSGRLSDRKIANIAETGAKTVITGNVVCHMQISEAVRERRLDAEVIHTMDVLARAYGVS